MTLPGHVQHLVIGAGFAGLCAAIRLQEDGETDFLVVEKGSDVGGTWRDNTYPGAACDVPSQLYSFSFAPNPDWSSSYSPQPEIQAYIKKVAERAGVLDRFVFDTAVEDADWDDDAQQWVVRTSAGTVTSTTLIVGAGGLSEPEAPPDRRHRHLPGRAVPLRPLGPRRRPRRQARRRHRHRRLGDPDHPRAAEGRRPRRRLPAHRALRHPAQRPHLHAASSRPLFKRVPALQKAYRAGIYWGKELLVPGFTVSPKLALPAKKLALANLNKGIKDPELRAKVTPTFEIGCKRILISNSYYPALASDNVDLVTDPIAKVTGNAVVTADGVERPIDVLVVATGFFTTELPIAEQIRGRDGASLADTWRDAGMAAYKGTTVHGFPNLFMIVGPNTGLGHSSMIFIIESQVEYIRDASARWASTATPPSSPRPRRSRSGTHSLQRRMKRTVWNTGGCSSWYLDAHGKNTVLWPRTTVSFRQSLGEFDVAAYDVGAPATSASIEGASA